MNYRIAVASSEAQKASIEKYVDLSFGECESFIIYEVDENDDFTLLEIRNCKNETKIDEVDVSTKNDEKCCCGGNGMGCSTVHSKKVEALSDCKCILCTRAGEKVKKIFFTRAISLFEIEGEVIPLIEKIIKYYARARR